MNISRIIFGLCLFLPATAAIAQSQGAADIGNAERAEHQQWVADTAGWVKEHREAADELTALAARLRSTEDELLRYEQKIKAHETLLKAGRAENADALRQHMAMRSAHEDMRLRHAAILTAIATLRQAVADDDDTGTPKM